jgi:hypothetical protein
MQQDGCIYLVTGAFLSAALNCESKLLGFERE